MYRLSNLYRGLFCVLEKTYCCISAFSSFWGKYESLPSAAVSSDNGELNYWLELSRNFVYLEVCMQNL